MMSQREALEVLAAHRGDQLVLTTMSSVGIWPSLSDTPLDFAYIPSAMGQGPSLGLGLALARPAGFPGWNDPKIAATLLLWLLFALLLYLRVQVRLGGTQLAVLTIMAFGLLLVTLVSTHTSIRGGLP